MVHIIVFGTEPQRVGFLCTCVPVGHFSFSDCIIVGAARRSSEVLFMILNHSRQFVFQFYVTKRVYRVPEVVFWFEFGLGTKFLCTINF